MDFQMSIMATWVVFRERFCAEYSYFWLCFQTVCKFCENSQWNILREEVIFKHVSAQFPHFLTRGLFILSVCGWRMPTSSNHYFIEERCLKNIHFKDEVIPVLTLKWTELESYIYRVNSITLSFFKMVDKIKSLVYSIGLYTVYVHTHVLYMFICTWSWWKA